VGETKAGPTHVAWHSRVVRSWGERETPLLAARGHRDIGVDIAGLRIAGVSEQSGNTSTKQAKALEAGEGAAVSRCVLRTWWRDLFLVLLATDCYIYI
jgi:hypothetical protein